MAFTNKRCVLPGHVLIAPFRETKRLIDLTPDEVSDLFQVSFIKKTHKKHQEHNLVSHIHINRNIHEKLTKNILIYRIPVTKPN